MSNALCDQTKRRNLPMNKILLIVLSLSLYSCNSQSNPTVTYKGYSHVFKADDYPKSIIDLYKEEQKLAHLSDREIAIKINADIVLEDLIDNLLRSKFSENMENLSQSHFDSIKAKLAKYYKAEKIDYFTKAIIIDRAQQWIADSLVQNTYGGRIYYDSLKKTPKPKEAYKKMVIDLIGKKEVRISDDFLKNEMIALLKNYLKKEEEMECNFNQIESWSTNK